MTKKQLIACHEAVPKLILAAEVVNDAANTADYHTASAYANIGQKILSAASELQALNKQVAKSLFNIDMP
jgi:conjugal transfer/entry exclusion protein